MYSNIETWFDSLITTVNSGITGTENDFKKVDTLIDNDNLPNNLSNRSYYMFLTKVEEMDWETKPIRVGVEVKFWFLIANAIGNYSTMLDTYLRALKQELKKFRQTEATTFNIVAIEEIVFDDLNKVIDKGTYVNPKLTFNLICYDKL